MSAGEIMHTLCQNCSIQADEEYCAFGSRSFGSEFLGPLVVVAQNANPNPPIACRAFKTQDVRRVIAVREVIGQFGSRFFVGYAADLHGPLAECSGNGAGFHQFDFHLRNAGLPDVYLVRRCQGKIDNAAWNEWSAVRDTHQGRIARLDIRDTRD